MKIKEVDRVPKHITTIGGQALIEGIMMRGPKDIAIAVRKPDGEMELKTEPLNTLAMRHKIFRMPFLRGVVALIEAMSIGTKALMYSAEFFEEEEEAESEKETFTQRVFKDKAEDVETMFTVLISVLLAVGIFMVLPGLKPGSDTFSLRFLGMTTMQILVMMFLLVGIIFGKIEDARYWAFSTLIIFGIILAIQSILFVQQVNKKQ